MRNPFFDTLQKICLSFPEAEEFVSHGAPNFRVRKGKVFALYTAHYHGDGRIAVWVNAPTGAQAAWTQGASGADDTYFVPPYLGPRGWLGIRLDRRLAWSHVYDLVHEAYLHTAPAKLHGLIGAPPTFDGVVSVAPNVAPSIAPELFDPLRAPATQNALSAVRAICLAWPECVEARQFGNPVWRAGKRTFAQLLVNEQQLALAFWVGGETQSALLDDPRFHLPAYLGHRGWIALDIHTHFDAIEIRAHLMHSYRQFALQRMLAKLAQEHYAAS
jgi:predicted DNA-binding protein (MmcQ/YjbR family)